MYGPVRKCQTATHFAKIQGPDGKMKLMPVVDKDLNKFNPNQLVKTTLTEINGADLMVPEVGYVSRNRHRGFFGGIRAAMKAKDLIILSIYSIHKTIKWIINLTKKEDFIWF